MLKAAALIFASFWIALVAFANPCAFDKGEMLRQDFKTFDQTLDAGWRVIGDIEGCEGAAADLIRDYREAITEKQIKSLKHHEAQLAAAAGQTVRAVALIQQLLAVETDAAMIPYREAELAFLLKDMDGLQAARAKLAAVPMPEGFADGVAKFKQAYPEADAPVWPINLDVVDKFITCFDSSYREAYNGCEPTD